MSLANPRVGYRPLEDFSERSRQIICLAQVVGATKCLDACAAKYREAPLGVQRYVDSLWRDLTKPDVGLGRDGKDAAELWARGLPDHAVRKAWDLLSRLDKQETQERRDLAASLPSVGP